MPNTKIIYLLARINCTKDLCNYLWLFTRYTRQHRFGFRALILSWRHRGSHCETPMSWLHLETLMYINNMKILIKVFRGISRICKIKSWLKKLCSLEPNTKIILRFGQESIVPKICVINCNYLPVTLGNRWSTSGLLSSPEGTGGVTGRHQCHGYTNDYTWRH